MTRRIYHYFVIGLTFISIVSPLIANAEESKPIAIVKADDAEVDAKPKVHATAYGSFTFIEAPLKGTMWLIDKGVQGIGKVGSLTIDGVLYPFRLIHRKQSGGIAHEKEKES